MPSHRPYPTHPTVVVLCAVLWGVTFVGLSIADPLNESPTDQPSTVGNRGPKPPSEKKPLENSLGLELTENAAGRLIVEGVASPTAASAAGLHKGDVILGVGSSAVSDRESLRKLLGQYQRGNTVELSVMRDGKRTHIEMRLLPRHDVEFAITPPGGEVGVLGMYLIENTDNRVQVSKVVPKSPADHAGIRPGDLLVEVSGHKLESLDEVGSAVPTSRNQPSSSRADSQAPEPTSVSIKLLRDSTPFQVTVNLPAEPLIPPRPEDKGLQILEQQTLPPAQGPVPGQPAAP